MARKTKNIIENGIDKREVGYYSTPEFIAQYITEEMLSINPNGEFVLDPATGKEELLPFFFNANKTIDSFDIIEYGEKKYSNYTKLDFIEYYKNFIQEQSFFSVAKGTRYDYIIANPPYNCHEVSYIKDNKKWLNKLFDVGAYNMYSMFLSAIINIAKEGCVIGVIISDSFLTSTYHSKLREQIFNTCSIHQIILCPNDLFWSQKADVRTCILILQKGKNYQGKVKISNRPKDLKELKLNLLNKNLKEVSLDSIRLNCKNTSNQIVIDVDCSIVDMFYNYNLLGNLFKCVTCISTGNDAKYLSTNKKEGFTIPFYKNPASRKFNTEADAFLIDSFMSIPSKDKNFMIRNKDLLYNEGIACSSMGLPFSAAYLPKEAVTGVNPTIYPPKQDINWLLSYLNSSLVTYLIRGVLIRSNMVTSGYVKCIPIKKFTEEEKRSLAQIAIDVRTGKDTSQNAIDKIDDIVFSDNIFTPTIIEKIKSFSKNLGKAV